MPPLPMPTDEPFTPPITSAAPKEDAPPFGWKKGELLGCGGFGRVYMGMNLDSVELLAVKQAHIKELEEEMKLLKNLSHPNIVRYLGTVTDSEALNILLDFVPGGSIYSLLEKFGSFPESELRELQELQRTLYTFLHVISTHDLASVFLLPKSRPYLDTVMQLLLYASCNHKDMFVRKTCVQIFIRLIKDWCGGPFGEEKVPGFERFIIEVFATNCCLYSVLNKSFEFRVANTHLLFGEIVTAQKVMYDKFGVKFVANFVSKGFLASHCSQDLAEKYHQKLQGNDMKALRLLYQSVIENMSLQQNGSLVFR